MSFLYLLFLWSLWPNASYKQQKGGKFYLDSHFQQIQSIVAWPSVLEQNMTSIRTSGRVSSSISANRRYWPWFNTLETSQEKLIFSKPHQFCATSSLKPNPGHGLEDLVDYFGMVSLFPYLYLHENKAPFIGINYQDIYLLRLINCRIYRYFFPCHSHSIYWDTKLESLG